MTTYLATTPDNLGEARGFTFKHCFEVDFLVARELPGQRNAQPKEPEEPEDSDSDETVRQPRWTAASDFVVDDVIDKCAHILRQNHEIVIIHGSSKDLDQMDARDEIVHEAWHLCPSPVAAAMDGSPSDYDWLPIRMRIPLQREDFSLDSTSAVRWGLATLRTELTIHVNSTCMQRIILRLDLDPLSLLIAKRLLSQIFITEFNLLRYLSPFRIASTVMGRSRACVESYREHGDSEIPADVTCHPCIPIHLACPITQRALQKIWSAKSMKELQTLTTGMDGGALAFSIDPVVGNDPTISFRYGIWHPYHEQDLTVHWIMLARAYLIVAHQPNHQGWTELMATLDSHAVFELSEPVSESKIAGIRAGRLLIALGYSEDQMARLLKFMLNYNRDGTLSKQNINRRGVLPRIRKILPSDDEDQTDDEDAAEAENEDQEE